MLNAIRDSLDALVPEERMVATPQVNRLLAACDGELSRAELQSRLGLEDRKHFHATYLQPALAAGLIEMTIPDKPRSSAQRYRLTSAGRRVRR